MPRVDYDCNVLLFGAELTFNLQGYRTSYAQPEDAHVIFCQLNFDLGKLLKLPSLELLSFFGTRTQILNFSVIEFNCEGGDIGVVRVPLGLKNPLFKVASLTIHKTSV